MFLYVPLFCLFCVFMVYNDYVNRRRDPIVKVVFITPDSFRSIVKTCEAIDGTKKQFAKKTK